MQFYIENIAFKMKGCTLSEALRPDPEIPLIVRLWYAGYSPIIWILVWSSLFICYIWRTELTNFVKVAWEIFFWLPFSLTTFIFFVRLIYLQFRKAGPF